jgi:hypothetical protein
MKAMTLGEFLNEVDVKTAYLTKAGVPMIDTGKDTYPVDVIGFDIHRVYVNIYRVDRCYGGPEEGGWWYDMWRLEDSLCIRHKDLKELIPIVERNYWNNPKSPPLSSVISQGEWKIYVELKKAESETTSRPHYE